MKKYLSIILIITILSSSILTNAVASEVTSASENTNAESQIQSEVTENDLIKQRLDSHKLVELKKPIDNTNQVATFSTDEVTDEDVKPEIGSAIRAKGTNKIPESLIEDAETETSEDYGIMTTSLTSTDYEAITSPSFKNGINHPHLNGRNVSEYVSPFDGTLQLNYTDLHLPGRNGLDLTLSRVYKSELSNVEASNSTGEYIVNNGTYYTNRYALGLGWAFGFPSVELRKKYDGSYQAFYHDGNGSAYRSNDNEYKENPDTNNGYLNYYTNLDNYYTDNVKFDEGDHAYSRDGVYSEYSFKTADDTMQYFAEDGRLLSIKDRFDNEIKFDYEYLPGENIIPFYSYSEYTLGSYWDYYVDDMFFDSGSSTRRSSEAKTQIVDLNEFYDEYYISLLYMAEDDGKNAFDGSFEVYCDFYSDGTLLESVLIDTEIPEVHNEYVKIESSISLEDLNRIPNQARLRISMKNSKRCIYFTDIRLSPKMPLISKITDTIGRTVNFEYQGDVYTRYEGSPSLPILVTVNDPEGNNIRNLKYYRNTYSYYVSNYEETEYEECYETRYFFLWGCDNGEESNFVDYEYFDGDGSTIYYYSHIDYSYYFYDRPIVNLLRNRNSKTYITYERVTKWTDNRPRNSTEDATKTNTGYIDTWRVIEKYDINYSTTDVENEKYNIYKYDYSTGAYTDETCYNLKRRNPKGPGFINKSLGTYKVLVTNPNGSQKLYEYTTHRFIDDYKLKWIITLPLLDMEKTMESAEADADYITHEYTYEDNYALISPDVTKTTECIDGTSRIYYTKTQYDDNSCLPIVTSLPLTEDELDNPPVEKLVTTEYASFNRTFLPEKVTYYKDFGEEPISEITTYDDLGRVLSTTDAVGNTVNYEYSTKYPWMPSRISFTDPENTGDTSRVAETLYEYKDNYGLGATQEKVKQNDYSYIVSKYEYEPKYGNIVSSTINGGTTRYTYDDFGRVEYVYYPTFQGEGTSEYSDIYLSDTAKSFDKYTYTLNSAYGNELALCIEKTTTYEYLRYETTEDKEYSVYKYDDYGNLLYQSTYAGEEKYIYDSACRVIGYQNPADFGSDVNTLSYSYDGFDRILSVTDKAGNVQQADYKSLVNEYSFLPSGSTTAENHVTVTYDMYGRNISESVYPEGINGQAVSTHYEYDLSGNVLKVTDANGKVTSTEYDSLNNPIKVHNADGSIVSYEYTKWGSARTTERKEGGETYTISSTFNDNGAELTHRQIGDKIYTRQWQYGYNENNQLAYKTDPNGTLHQYLYDKCGNLKVKIVGGLDYIYGYTYFGSLESASQYANGNSKKYEQVYNEYTNRKLTKSEYGVDETTINYTYNDSGNLTSIVPEGYNGVLYTRDNLERVTQITSGEKQFTYEYYPDGLVKKLTYPNSNIYVGYTYDNANRLTNLVVNKGAEVIKTYSYTYDNIGNIISVSGSDNITYTYDDLCRLKTYTENDVTTTYEYDSRNNIISETKPDYVKTYEYGGDNRLHSTTENGVVTEYDYDLNGNMINRGDDEFVYNHDNLLVYSRVDGVETKYTISAQNLRKRKTTGEDITEYIVDQNGRVICENEDEIINGTTPLAIKRGESYYYYICNGHGDVVMLLDEDGNVKNSYSYNPWGKITAQTEQIPNNIKYAGEYYDEENDLIYLRNRYYDPSICRFTSEDPIRDQLNWYAYCGNNPVNYIDPLGLDAVVITNRNGAQSSVNNEGSGIPMGHMAIVVQNEDGDWYYFSCGKDYVAWKQVDNKYMSDINALSKECYWEGMYYTDATYIKGDFSDSWNYFKKYYDNNSSNGNENYSLLSNNCSTVVMNGLTKGELKDGTKVSTYIYSDINNDNRLVGSPNSIMKSLQNIFYNSEFTKDASHKVINDLLWEKKNGVWWNRNPYMASRLEKLH